MTQSGAAPGEGGRTGSTCWTIGAPPSDRTWNDGETRVNVGFTAKGESKSAVALQHERLPDAQEAQRMKDFWKDRVAELKEVLER
jgi:hypothetical protein